MKFLTSIFLVLIINSALAHESNEPNLYSRLLEINKEWKHVPSREYQEKVSFSNDKDLISTHLNLVIEHLRNNAPKYLQPEQLDNRLSLLSKLQVYAQAKIFPSNLYHRERTPYFIDHLGVHCAVGYMIQQSGRPDLAFAIQNRENYADVRDIQTGGIEEWALTNGFTISELAWIQPAYMSSDPAEPLDGGTNGEITDLAYDVINNKLYFIGDFSNVTGSSDICGKVAYVQNNQIACISADLVGDPSSIFLDGQNLYLTGEFQDQGTTYNLAMYQGAGNWTFENVTDLAGAETVRMFMNSGAATINSEFAVDLGSHHEIWAHEISPNNDYTKKITVYGEVHYLSHTGNEYIYAGEFDSCLVHKSTGDSMIYCTNILIQDLSQNYHSPSGDYPEIIYSVEPYNGQFLISGQCSNAPNSTCISRMNPNTYDATTELSYGYIQTTIPGSVEIAVIKNLQVIDNTSFVFSGDFIAANFMNYGRNLAYAVEIPGQGYIIQEKGSTNRKINDFYASSDEIIIGGNFTADAFRSDLNHLASYSGFASISEVEILDLNISPNPSEGIVKLRFGKNQSGTIRVFDMKGQVIHQVELDNEKHKTLALVNTSPGLYILNIEVQGQSISKKIQLK
jgi:hypothetical protein